MEASLLVIDQEPLRREASAACRRILRDLEKARAEWTRFTEEDQPAYARWISATFGPLLTKARGLKEELEEKLLLIEEVEEEHFLGGGSRYSAYYAVMRRRDDASRMNHAQPDEPEPEYEIPNEPELDETEKKALFEEFVRSTFGISPRALPREDYAALRAEFDKAMFEEEARAEPPPARSAPHRGEAVPLSARIKEKYRWLVRQLHPDTQKEKRPDFLAIWHEVQKAYLERDLERLETLAALVEMREGLMGDQTSLFQARAAMREMKASLRALARSLKEARADVMWRFSTTTALEREKLATKVGRELRSEVDCLSSDLERVNKALEIWSRRPPERARHTPEQREARAGRRQKSFQF